MTKVDELVEWVAEIVEGFKDEGIDWVRFRTNTLRDCDEVARQILSHPDLALIVKRMEVPVCCQECQCQNLFYDIKEVISLAEALKEEK